MDGKQILAHTGYGRMEKDNLDWMSLQAQDKHRTSTGQVQDKYRTSTVKVLNQFITDNHNILQLVLVISERQMSVKEMMETLSLKGRDNFLKVYLNPSIEEQYVRLLYPKSPRHPRQKYLLTVKGFALYNEFTQDASR